MFGFIKLSDRISVLDGYIQLNNQMYTIEEVAEKLKRFDEEYGQLLAKNGIKAPGYEKYTETYVMNERIDLIKQLFSDNPGLVSLAHALKHYMNQNKKKIFTDAGMTTGSDPLLLLVEEVVFNETACKHALGNLRLEQQTKDIYGKKPR